MANLAEIQNQHSYYDDHEPPPPSPLSSSVSPAAQLPGYHNDEDLKNGELLEETKSMQSTQPFSPRDDRLLDPLSAPSPPFLSAMSGSPAVQSPGRHSDKPSLLPFDESSKLEINLKHTGRITWYTEHGFLQEAVDIQLNLNIDTSEERAVIFLHGKLFSKKRQPLPLYIFLSPKDIMSIHFTPQHPHIPTYDVSASLGFLCFTMARPPSLVGPREWPLEPKMNSKDLLENMKALSRVCEFAIELGLPPGEAEFFDKLASLRSVFSANSPKCFGPDLESFLRSLYSGDGGQCIEVATNTIADTSFGYQTTMINSASSRFPDPTHNSAPFAQKRHRDDGSPSPGLLTNTHSGKRRRADHTSAFGPADPYACQSTFENPASPEQQLQRITDVWAPSDNPSILNDRIATLQTAMVQIQTHIDDLTNEYSPCRYDTEEAEAIKVQAQDFTERQVQDMRTEVVGEFTSKLEESVQEEIATLSCDVQDAVQNELSDEIEEIRQSTQGLGNQFDKIAAEVKDMITKVAEIEHNTNNRLDRLEQNLQSSTRGTGLPIDFEIAVNHILVTYAAELTADEKMNVLEFLQANPSSATVYNLCGSNSDTSLQRNFINKWKRNSPS